MSDLELIHFQKQLEHDWSELNYTRKVRKHLKDKFENLSEVQLEILTQAHVDGFTPASNIIGAVAAKLDPCPSTDDRKAVLAELVALAKADMLNIVLNKIVYVEPLYLVDDPDLKVTRKHFIPPMLCKPLAMVHNDSSPYLTGIRFHAICGHATSQHGGEIRLDVINKQNYTGFSLNEWVLNNCCDDKPDGMRQEDWDNYIAKSNELFNLVRGQEFFIPHKVDKRGRLYAHAHHINYQGNEFRRALIDFSTPEYIEGGIDP